MSNVVDRLRQAERRSRRLQHEISADDAAALVRTWPSVVRAANATWLSLPTSLHFDDRTLERATLGAAALTGAIDSHIWPGNGSSNDSLDEMATDLHRGAHHDDLPAVSAAEASEGQRLILSTLWTAARTVGTAAKDHSFDVRYDRTLTPQRRERTAQLAGNASRRIAASEHLMATALFGTTDRPGSGSATLRHSIASWDIQAHRALVGHRTSATLHAVSFHQAQATVAFGHFIDSAHADGVLDQWSHERLNGALRLSATAWKDVHAVAKEFSFDTVPLPISLHDAAKTLRDRLGEPSSSTQGHRDTLTAISEHLSSAVSLAILARDLTADGELRAPARAIARLMADRFPDMTRSVVSAEDIRRGASVTLPADARELLAEATTRAVHTAAEAMDRAAGLDEMFRRPESARAAAIPERSLVPTREEPSPTINTETVPRR